MRRDFIASALSSDLEDCILWPYAVRKTTGYGAHSAIVEIAGERKKRNFDAHRYVCEAAHGKPARGFEAAHRCGIKLCVNPRHLYWATHEENMQDAKAHRKLVGGGASRQKLFAEQISEIASSPHSILYFAKRYDMEPSHIAKVRRVAREKAVANQTNG